MSEKAILGLATTGIALSTLGYALKKVRKKRKRLKDLIEAGTGTIVGVEFTKASGDVVAGM